MEIDLFIPGAPKDYTKIPYILKSVQQNVPDIKRAFVVTPDKIELGDVGFPVISLRDNEVLDINPEMFSYRPKWVYQQFLKLFQDVTDDWYMVIDADRFFNRRVILWDKKPIMLFLNYDQYHDPYFVFNQRMLGFGKTYKHSFLSECTLYSKSLIQEMLHDCGHDTAHEFIEAASSIIDGGCYPAESELYGSWVYRNKQDVYEYKTIKAVFGGKYGSKEYSESEIESAIADYRFKDVDVFSLHSWEGSI